METTIFTRCFLVCFYLLSSFPPENFFLNAAEEKIKYNIIHRWADKLSAELELVGDYITRRQQVQESFKQTQITSRSGSKIAEEMAKEIKYMMDTKVSAVRRIIDIAENTAMSVEDKEEKAEEKGEKKENDTLFTYYNAKEMIEPGEASSAIPEFDENGNTIVMVPPPEIILTPNPRFNHVRVNTTYSSVHVPTNVHDRAKEVIKAIKWSEALDRTFYNNYRENPSLSWQYFGSSTGFLRQFPASKWQQDPVDLYDCRLRSWYIEAANSPKDMVILIDNSGSMTGQRKDIAKHVVGSILDTLGPNDYVNIYTFAESVEEVVPCFANGLVQANMGNVRELKLGLEYMNTTGIANVSAALTKAFDILDVYRTEEKGAHCNQAIMLVSDGVPYDYKDIFEYYNWRNLPNMPVRVFTYLIGREVADVKEIKWMACENQGYYVHLSTLAEVREEVLNYIPVMARPLVLWRQDHPVIWSDIYADVVDPKMTDWLWEVKECEEQKERFMAQRKNKALFHSTEEQDRRTEERRRINRDEYADSTDYQFMTTVSMPVYDRRENATKVANLLGVAGTDIPINDIKRLMRPFMLGVNGYAFIVTNNGYIIIHPDFRPVFQNILKPAYNNVDMLEVELLDDDRDPRDFNPVLLEIRNSIINQENNSKWLMVKYHHDGMKRVSRTKRQYFWTPIENTSYTLVVTYPEPYGVNRIQIPTDDEIHRVHVKGINVSNFFNRNHTWKIHPDWLYCKYSNITFSSPEEELLHFWKKMREPRWKWPLNRTPPPPEHAALYSNTSSGRFSSIFDKDSYYCDRNLMQSLVYDAKVTEWFSKNNSFTTSKDEKGYEFKQRFGITVAFLATHSGLTRWQDFHNISADEPRPEPEFSEYNSRAIDEIWYKRAVEQHAIEPMSFVYSVPFEAASRNDTLVTASNAIFHTEKGKSAPVAVVGFQFQHSALVTLFKNVTSSCLDGSCNYTCARDGIDCFILDNNGYILISPDTQHTGRFFGEIRSDIMQRLLEDYVYKRVVIYDYQAICFASKDTTNPASILKAPFQMLYKIFTNVFSYIMLLSWQFITLPYEIYASSDAYPNEDYNYPEPTEPNDMPPSKAKEQEFDKRVLLNRTRPQPCDHIITLYKLNDTKDITAYKTPLQQCERPYVVMPINGSNLILLVIDAECPIDNKPTTIIPEIKDFYDNSSLACYRGNSAIPRRRPQSCINQHHNESAIKICGKAFYIQSNLPLIIFASMLIIFQNV